MSKPKKNTAKNRQKKKTQGRGASARSVETMLADVDRPVEKDYSMNPYSSSVADWFEWQSQVVTDMTADVLKEYNERQTRA